MVNKNQFAGVNPGKHGWWDDGNKYSIYYHHPTCVVFHSTYYQMMQVPATVIRQSQKYRYILSLLK
jgi:hypothetical protein